MDRGTGGDGGDVGGVGVAVAADVGDGRVLDALLALGVLGHARDGPVFFFRDAVDHQAGEGVWTGFSEIAKVLVERERTYSEPGPLLRRG